jgi:hypothetical protein
MARVSIPQAGISLITLPCMVRQPHVATVEAMDVLTDLGLSR